ncbi:MAG: branched-chain-amino-acid transaminase [Candidatus Omnitrophica bacterium]|nr:branched-chain-amino-acid transaminase [Candidatus Omnitrophota bacterium]
MKIYINGKFYDKENAKISVFDHGLLYGDGVFEGIRAYDRLVFKLKEHIVRLYESAHSIMLKINITQEQMIKAVVQTLKANNLDNAYIRLIVTRGAGDLGLDPRKCNGNSTVIIIADKIALYPEKLYKEGMEIITVPTVRNMPEMVNPQIKSLNYLNNILAKIEALNCGYDEAIMMDSLGYVAECTGDNIFIVKNSELYTPPQCMGTLRGITRDAVLEIASRAKIPVHEHVLTRHEVYIADESFLTGTAAEVIPVVKVDGRMIGKAKPGKVTLELMRLFKKMTQKYGVKY